MLKVFTALIFNFIFITDCYADIDLTKLLSNVEFKHKWVGSCEKDKCDYKSSYEPPFPFNKNSPVEYRLTVEVFSNKINSTTLQEILNSEVGDIKSQMIINEYLEEDRPSPENNIAVFTEEINTKEVGFIKYRTKGSNEHPAFLPLSVTHGIYLDSNQIVMVHLITFFAGHHEEVRGDLRSILDKLTKSF